MLEIEQLKTLVADLELEGQKFFNKKNKAAGTRLRKKCQEIKALAQKIRISVNEIKNS